MKRKRQCRIQEEPIPPGAELPANSARGLRVALGLEPFELPRLPPLARKTEDERAQPS